jgi:hypothetical protein
MLGGFTWGTRHPGRRDDGDYDGRWLPINDYRTPASRAST